MVLLCWSGSFGDGDFDFDGRRFRRIRARGGPGASKEEIHVFHLK